MSHVESCAGFHPDDADCEVFRLATQGEVEEEVVQPKHKHHSYGQQHEVKEEKEEPKSYSKVTASGVAT